MDLLLMLLTLTVLKSAGVYASTCSILPGGLDCFPDTVDKNKYGEIREINYQLDEKTIFGSEINNDETDKSEKINVRLGRHWQKQVGTKTDTVTCRDEIGQLFYATKLYAYDVGREKSVKEFFVETKIEIWNCALRRKEVLFTRVLTEHVSIRKLGWILFYDGIKIVTIPNPFTTFNTSIVREVKYVDPNDRETVLRFDGRLKFKESSISSTFVPIGPGHDIMSINENEIEVSYNKGMTKKYRNIGNTEGLDLDDSKRPKVKIGSLESHAICQMQDYNEYNKADYLPSWTEKRKLLNGEKEELVPLDFLSTFMVTKYEIWSCKMDDDDTKTTFERRVFEYIGKNIKTIGYFNGIEVWKFQNEFKRYIVGIRSVYYYTKDEPFERKIYAGSVELEELEELEEEKPKMKKGFLTSMKRLCSIKVEEMPKNLYKLNFDQSNDSIVLESIKSIKNKKKTVPTSRKSIRRRSSLKGDLP